MALSLVAQLRWDAARETSAVLQKQKSEVIGFWPFSGNALQFSWFNPRIYSQDLKPICVSEKTTTVFYVDVGQKL